LIWTVKFDVAAFTDGWMYSSVISGIDCPFESLKY
jgi:hypothetical protein